MPLARVRPGLTHGCADQYPAGSVFEATEAELTSFADKLERLPEPEPVAPEPEPEPEPAPEAVKPAGKRRR